MSVVFALPLLVDHGVQMPGLVAAARDERVAASVNDRRVGVRHADVILAECSRACEQSEREVHHLVLSLNRSLAKKPLYLLPPPSIVGSLDQFTLLNVI